MKQLFIPEMLTPLFYTPLYQTLSDEERLSYNQLHGQYFLEQTIFFEQLMGKPALRQLIRIAPDKALADEARDFINEEDTHTSWFRELLRKVQPRVYQHRDFHLLKMPWLAKTIMALTARTIRWMPCLIWLQLIAEERALYFGRCYLRVADQLDPRFIAVQKKHLADEPSHIRRDELFLHWLWPRCSARIRKINACILHWLLREFFYFPKRSGWRVVSVWLESQPQLLARRHEFYAAMNALEKNQTFIHSLYPKKHLSRTLALSASWPELDFFQTLFTDEPV
jgi:hypothetical protein